MEIRLKKAWTHFKNLPFDEKIEVITTSLDVGSYFFSPLKLPTTTYKTYKGSKLLTKILGKTEKVIGDFGPRPIHEGASMNGGNLGSKTGFKDSSDYGGLWDSMYKMFYKKDRPDSVEKIGGRYPMNSHYAGQVYHFKDLPKSIQKQYPHLEHQYPEGIRFNKKGFPDFSSYAIKKVEIKMTGNHRIDKKRANEGLGYKPNAEHLGYTWHHHENGKTMELVPRDLHDAFRHTGGVSVINNR